MVDLLFIRCIKKQTWLGKYCIKRFCKDLRENAMKIINYEKTEMIQLTDEETEFYENQKVCQICKKEFSNDKND